MNVRLPRKLFAIMFTDIVGFTRLMQQDEPHALQVRRRHRDVMEEVHDVYQGEIVRYFGDGSLSLFANALDAVQCAVEMQAQFRESPEVPLRIGIHLGNVIVEPDAVIGDAANIASRMESFSIAGGVLISETVQNEIKNQPQIRTKSLGKFHLKNVDRPYEIFAISSGGLTVPDPAYLEGKGERTAVLPGRLPTPATPLLGRENEMIEVASFLSENRVVTITGPGGIGKTRLAIEVTRTVADDFADRLAYVPMAPVSDASRFIPSLASALNIKEAEGRGFRDGITSVIADKRALLVLDNLEQIITSAVDIADLVSTCPNLKILTTSRMPLKISAEQEYPLEPLSLPERKRLDSLEEALASPAVALFADRAKKANHRFQMTLDNAPAVAEICHRLDGLPLAIELAAAKARILSPESLLKRLTATLDVLNQGSRDLPERHQTLRATIDWSHALLSEGEKILFRRLSVFSGGFTLEGAEAVCLKEDKLGSFELLSSLLEHGLVQRQGKADRYITLQTIKEYALEKLEEAEELARLRRDHAQYFLDVARQIHLGTQGKDQLARMEMGDREEANLQSALEWSLAGAKKGDAEAGDLGLQICGELWMYWHIRGMHISARDWIDKLLEATGGHRPAPGVSAALLTAGLCSWTLGHYPRAVEELVASYRIADELDLPHIMAASAGCLAIAHMPLGEMELAAKNARESIDLSRKLDYEWMLGFALAFDGLLSFVNGDLQGAREKYYRGLEIQRRIGDYEGGGFSLGGLAQLAQVSGDSQEAIRYYKDALDSYVRVGDRAEEARIFEEMAWTFLKMEETGEARRNFLNSIEAYQDVGSVRGIGLALLGLSAAEQVEGSSYRAVQLAAAAKRFTEEEGIVNVYTENNPAQEYLDAAKKELAPDKILEAEGQGRLLSVEDALKFAIESA